MITVPEAARRTGRNPETIRRWIRDGRLASTRVGTQYLVDEAQLADLADESEVVPSSGDATATGEPVPNFVAALHRSRAGR